MSARRRLRAAPSAEPRLTAHLRTAVWGPAEFVGVPPFWLLAEGVLVGTLSVTAILGLTLFGAWTGRPSLADGEAGLVCAAALALYLTCVGAGRALVGVTALLAACLALHTPQAAAGMVLAERGRVESAVVTSVEGGADAGRGRYYCAVADARGVPLGVRIWRGCDQTTRPGDALAVVHDPRGTVPPRGVAQDASGPLGEVAPWAGALVAVSVLAVVRSFRLAGSAGAPDRRRPARRGNPGGRAAPGAGTVRTPCRSPRIRTSSRGTSRWLRSRSGR